MGIHSLALAGRSWRLASHKLMSRRFPPPCSVKEQAACFVVRDHGEDQISSGLGPVYNDPVGAYLPSILL
jgi:hypothetical protein